METQTPKLIDKLKSHIDRKEWDEAVRLLSELKAVDEADMFSELGRKEKRELVPHLSHNDLVTIMTNLSKDEALDLSSQVEETTLSQTLNDVSPDLAADMLHRLPADRAHQVLAGMEDQEEVAALLGYGDETAGGLMTP